MLAASDVQIALPPRTETEIDRFTGRQWLLPQVVHWWERTADRYLVLTGGPGTGKSMFLAWLAGFGPAPEASVAQAQLDELRRAVKAAHFCQALSRNIAPKAFAESIANQLTRTVPDFAAALAATLSERVQIAPVLTVGPVAPGGTATNLTISRLDLGGLGDELSFDNALITPLKKLFASGAGEPLLILVDALDEAFGYTGERTLPDLLSAVADLPAQARFLVSTRDDPRVMTYYRDVSRLDLIAKAPSNIDDVEAYALQRLRAGAALTAQRRKLARRIAERSEGVFLYAAIVLDDLLSRLAHVPALEDYPLPAGLSGLYHQFLRRELGTEDKGRRWFEVYRPLLGLVAVALGEGLTAKQLAGLVGKDVDQALRSSRQYLSGQWPAGPFRPFHRSFADFLLDDQANDDFHIDATAMHARIAEHYYAAYAGAWSRCDDYGLEHLPAHLVAAGMDTRAVELAAVPYLLAKVHRFHDYRLVRDDLLQALVAAERTGDAIAVVRLGLMLEGLRARAASTPLEELAPLYALLGEERRAVALLDVAPVAWKRAAALRAIVALLAFSDHERAMRVSESAGTGDVLCECLVLVLKGDLFRRGWHVDEQPLVERIHALAGLETNRKWQSWLLWELHEALEGHAGAEAVRAFESAVAYARQESDPQMRCIALRRLAQSSAASNRSLSARLFVEALDALEHLSPSGWRAECFGELVGELASIDRAEALRRARACMDSQSRARALLHIAVLVAVGSKPDAEALLLEADGAIHRIMGDTYKSERRIWHHKAKEMRAQVAQRIADIAQGASVAPTISVEASQLPLRPVPELTAGAGNALLQQLDAAMIDPPDPATVEQMVLACLQHGRGHDGRRLVQEAIRHASRPADLEWSARLTGQLIGEIARKDSARAIKLARECALGRDEAIVAIAAALAGDDVEQAISLLCASPPQKSSLHAQGLAALLVEAARTGATASVRLLMISLLHESGAKELTEKNAHAEIADILETVTQTHPVLLFTDLLCDTFAAASAHLALHSRDVATALWQWTLRYVSGDPAEIGRAIACVAARDVPFALDLARTAVAAYHAKTTLSDFARSEGVVEVLAGTASSQPRAALELLTHEIERSTLIPHFAAMGCAAVAHAVAADDRSQAAALLQRARTYVDETDIDWMKADALLRMAAFCVPWDKPGGGRLLEEAIALARHPKRGKVLVGRVLAEAAKVFGDMGQWERAEACLNEACDQMRSDDADAFEMDALEKAALCAPPELAAKTALRLVKALCERGALWAGTSRLMLWSDQLVRILFHGAGDRRIAVAEALLEQAAAADKSVEEIFIG